MLAAFGDTLKELLGSKKFILFVATVVATGAAKIGWHVDTTTLDHYLELAAALIVAQGIADHGKGAEEEKGRNDAAAREAGVPAPAGAPAAVVNVSAPPGKATTGVMLALAAAGGAIYFACTGAGGVVKKGVTGVIDCAKEDVSQAVGDQTLLATVAQDLAQDNYAAALDALISKLSEGAVACAVKDVQSVLAAQLPHTAEPGPTLRHANAVLTDKRWTFTGSSK